VVAVVEPPAAGAAVILVVLVAGAAGSVPDDAAEVAAVAPVPVDVGVDWPAGPPVGAELDGVASELAGDEGVEREPRYGSAAVVEGAEREVVAGDSAPGVPAERAEAATVPAWPSLSGPQAAITRAAPTTANQRQVGEVTKPGRRLPGR
jgi:hypothetical protein